MSAKKKNTPENDENSTLSKHTKDTGLSMDELKIISEMLKESLLSEYGRDVSAFPKDSAENTNIKGGSLNSNNPISGDSMPGYYESDPSNLGADEDYPEDLEDYDIESFRAHSPTENFYSLNDVKECPMCGSKVNNFGHYSLEFGSNIRKRANFCGLDCLKQFIDELSFSKGF